MRLVVQLNKMLKIKHRAKTSIRMLDFLL